jgi:hypothetical protein
MGRRTEADPGERRHAAHSIVAVPMDKPGLVVERHIPVVGHHALDCAAARRCSSSPR